jgi:hypothetical protein
MIYAMAWNGHAEFSNSMDVAKIMQLYLQKRKLWKYRHSENIQ